ncbi:hypothetical protein CGC58_02400 [Capnocytophaga stomatis]|uniref:Uncharacterized protein n=1 Tax=Capnocytophaga stomatis TaxID=1848904 RepID=A0A250FX77_9FLAO|nr:hypothetical protein [Capnocytophaga stomatis]ATA88688.1 hypothetical protein CGC58_02400 [Capnocytophaga stomatis]
MQSIWRVITTLIIKIIKYFMLELLSFWRVITTSLQNNEHQLRLELLSFWRVITTTNGGMMYVFAVGTALILFVSFLFVFQRNS